MPATVPGDFTVLLGAVISGRTHRGLVEGMDALGGASGLLSWVRWVEYEAQGFPKLLEGLRLLRGAVMAVAAPVVGRL